MRHSVAWRPPTDIYETSDAIIVVADLAGVSEDAVTVTLFSDLLVVEGRREQSIKDMSACHQLGITYGDFRSEIALHVPVDHEKVKVDHKNGLLKITLQKLF
jgi:HSP20 family protein